MEYDDIYSHVLDSADFPVHAMSAANNVNYKSKTNASFIVVAPAVVVVVVAV